MTTRPLHGNQYGTTPLAADANALQGAQDGQDHGAPDADRVVTRHKGYKERGDAHQQERRDQGCLAADAIAVMPEDGGAYGAANEADEVGAEGRQGPGQKRLVWEE